MGETPRVLIATTNQGKLRELVPLLADCGHLLVRLAELGVDTDVPETGSTFEENATVKATAYAQMTGMLTLAEDSGLEIDALGGEPGVLSSRFAGEATPYDRKISLLLQKLKRVDESNWRAGYRCVIALASPSRAVELFAGECRGRIVKEARGRNGFGYDPVFMLDSHGRTMAELSLEEKNRVSHRSKAARKAAAALRRMAAPQRRNAG